MNSQNVALDHLNLTVYNFVDSVNWYKRIFGFSLVEEGIEDAGPWGVLRNGDSMLCIYESPGRTNLDEVALDRFHHIYHFGLRIKDRIAWEEIIKTESLITYYGSPIQYPHSFSWYIKDPTEYMIEVALWNEDQVQFG